MTTKWPEETEKVKEINGQNHQKSDRTKWSESLKSENTKWSESLESERTKLQELTETVGVCVPESLENKLVIIIQQNITLIKQSL